MFIFIQPLNICTFSVVTDIYTYGTFLSIHLPYFGHKVYELFPMSNCKVNSELKGMSVFVQPLLSEQTVYEHLP